MSRGLRVVVRVQSRLGRFISGSAAAHVALAVVALIVPMTRPRVGPIEDTMTVSLAGPIGGGATAPQRRVEAAAAPAVSKPSAPAPKEAHTVREVPVPKPKEKPVKPKKETAPPKETEHDTPPSAGDSKASGPEAKGPGPATPGAPTGVTASVGGGDASLGWYGAAVKAALESAWQKPYLEDQTGTASVVIAFDIARDGATRDVRIVTSSGVPTLDRSAQRAVIEASPLPALPPTWKDDTLPATMRFDLSPESH